MADRRVQTTHSPKATAPVRWRLRVSGQVQGVGFRPYVYRLARQMDLAGYVANDPAGATVEIEGPREVLERFCTALLRQLPPLAEVSDVQRLEIEPRNDLEFVIRRSSRSGDTDAQVTVDVGICDACLAELFDPADRRWRYPFINCTDCGPRYTIVKRIPYDRPNTTMAVFEMCQDCRGEYEDPLSRRFHAQPIACGACGPKVWLADASGREVACQDAIAAAANWLREGKILAIKGLGGFHLACLAEEDEPVALLRGRKRRDHKPFAMMAGSLEQIERVAEVSNEARRLLRSPARPIVLLPRKSHAQISELVAPGSDTYGLMLPYTPLHYLLFAEGLGLLVMTSGNLSDEPICKDNHEALERLAGIADAFLLHDRDIERRVDDSVVQVRGEERLMVRRARGYVPKPIRFGPPTRKPILALGADLKNTVCFLRAGQAVLSEHIGDLAHASAYRHFVQAIDHLKDLLEIEPQIVAYDLHPGYLSSQYARHLDGLEKVGVQHHFAHVVSCMAEHDLDEPVIGIACDGTGYGQDGAIWGCEVLRAERGGFSRLGHLRYFPLAGGDAAAKELARPAMGVLYETFGPAAFDLALLKRVPEPLRRAVGQMLERQINVVSTSSLGRFFDAAALLVGLANYNHFEGQGPMALEAAIIEDDEHYPHAVLHFGRRFELDYRPSISAMVADLEAGLEAGRVAARFHNTVVELLKVAAVIARDLTDLSKVVLSGGCFVNRYLTERLRRKLESLGFEVYTHREVPCNDGGIALGQAAVAAALAN